MRGYGARACGARLFEFALNPMEVAAIIGHKLLVMLNRSMRLREELLAQKLGRQKA